MSTEQRHVTKAEVTKEVKQESKEVKKAKKEGRKAKLNPPPPPPIKLENVPNPLIGSSGLKRAMAVAIAMASSKANNNKLDEDAAALAIRQSGILFKKGYKPDAVTDELAQNEWSGKPYLKFVTNSPEGKAYPEKHADKVKACMPFAEVLVKTVVQAVAQTSSQEEKVKK